MATGPYYLGVDLGGTNIKAGVVDDTGVPLSSINRPTEADKGPVDGVRRMAQAAREAVQAAGMQLSDIAALGVGSPGPMDLDQQIIINPYNLPGWVNIRLADEVGKHLGLRGVLQNDANAAAYGEFWGGAGRGFRSLVQFTLGTGIGCGVVIDGILLEGRHSHGAEAGHMRIDFHPNARMHNTGRRGILESYVSATGVVNRTREALDAGEESTHLRRMLGSGQTLTSKLVFQTAEAGDNLAQRIVAETAYLLGIGAVNVMHVIDPDIVVFSGGMIAAGQGFLEAIRRSVKENALPVPGERTRVVFAELGEDAGFIGAAACARSKFATTRS